MPENFDPYYEWLGIPPKDQPPNHYRLLGIEVFEPNLNVIERAADRQMGHVRTFQSGKHSRASQELLNRLSAAKVCLLNPQKKAEYDTELRAALAPARDLLPEEIPLDPALLIPTPADPFDVGPRATDRSVNSRPSDGLLVTVTTKRHRHSHAVPRVKIALVGVVTIVVAAVLIGTVVAVLLRSEKPSASSQPGKQPAEKPTSLGGETSPLPSSTAGSSPTVPTSPTAFVNEFQQPPSDPTGGNSWPSPPEALVNKLASSFGTLHDDFAMSQTTDISEFLAVAPALRPLGYVPIRVRPYSDGPQVCVASVWARVGLPWRLVCGLPADEITKANEGFKAQGFMPIDVAGWTTGGTSQFSALWLKAPQPRPTELFVGVLQSEHENRGRTLGSSGMMCQTRNRFSENGQWRVNAIWVQRDARRQGWGHTGGLESYRQNLTKGLPFEVSISMDSSRRPVYIGQLLWQDNRRFAESSGLSPPEHWQACQYFVEQGLRPLAISAAVGQPGAPATTASIWVETAAWPFPDSPARAVSLADVTTLNESESKPQDPPPSETWPAPPDASRQRIVSGKGLLHEQFAFCQTMPLAEFIETVRELRNSGYRPIRARPYEVNGTVQVAGVWSRDGLPWRIVTGVTRPEFEQAHSLLESEGFVPIDLSGWASESEFYTGLWAKLDSAIPSRLAIGLTKEEHEQLFAEVKETGYVPRAHWRFPLADGQLRYCSIFLKPPVRPTCFLFGGTFSYFTNQVGQGMPIDAGHFREGGGLRLGGIVLTGDKRQFVESHSETVDEHLKRCEQFVQQGLKPLVISVAGRLEDNQLAAASVWVESSVGTFPELKNKATTSPVASNSGGSSTPAKAPVKAKLPAPTTAQIDAAAARVRDALKSRVAANNTPVKQIAFSAALVGDARDAADPATKFAFLLKARDVAVESGDAWAALRALDALTESFDVDPWALRSEMIEKVAQKAKTEGARRLLAEAALSLSHEASVEAKFDVAEKMISPARRVKDLARVAAARAKLLTQQKQLAQSAEEARITLDQTPDDAAANLIFGRFLCFVKEDWTEGLIHLSKGSDPALAEIAQQELAGPVSPREQFSLSEKWIAWATKNNAEESSAAWRRAQHWLSQAIPLLTGPLKTRAVEHSQNAVAKITQSGEVQRNWRGRDQSPGDVMRLSGHTGGVTTLAASRSSRWLVSGSRDDTVRVWDLTLGTELSRITTTVNDVSSLALLPDEQTLILVGQNTKVMTASLTAAAELGGFDVKSSVQDIVMSADGRRLLLTIPGPQGNVIVSETNGTGQIPLPIKTNIRAIDLSRSGTLAAVADENNVVHLWDLRRPGDSAALNGFASTVCDVAISPNEELVAGCYSEGVVLWNANTRQELSRITVPRGALRIGFTLDSRRLIVSSTTNDLSVLDVRQGTMVASLTARNTGAAVSSCDALVVLPDGHGAVTAGYDGAMIVWRLPD